MAEHMAQHFATFCNTIQQVQHYFPHCMEQ